MSQRSVWFLKYLGIFFIIPIIGTLAHEFGHWFVAVCVYQEPAYISYAFTHLVGALSGEEYFWFIMGGPLSTWLTAAAGITVIFLKYRSMHSETEIPVGIGQSLAIVAAAFSLRFIFNAGGYFLFTTILGNPSNADEVKIANYLGISPDITMYGSAIIALILVLITLYYIPRHQRYIILFSGILGGILGYIFWYYWVGPILLP